jgi:Ca2+-binding EF-hand superfamily protein
MGKDLARTIRDMSGRMAEDGKAKDAADTILQKVGEEVVPFVAESIFDFLDSNRDSGVSKDEIDCAVQGMMQGPEAVFHMLFTIIDKNRNGSLSVDEIAEFFKELVTLYGNCLLVFINVFAANFKEDMIDGVVEQAFAALDANGDGALDKEELAPMTEGLMAMSQGIEQMTEAAEDDPVAKMVKELLDDTIARCSTVGDCSPDGFYQLCCDLVDACCQSCYDFLHSDELPIPPEMLEKFGSFITDLKDALVQSCKDTMRPVTDAYFELLDADGDGTLQTAELMALVNVFTAGGDVDEKFNALFHIVDTDGDGKCDCQEVQAFMKKGFDIAVATGKNCVEVYLAVVKAVAHTLFAFFVKQFTSGGDEMSAEQFKELSGSFAQDGPEALLAPLMQ